MPGLKVRYGHCAAAYSSSPGITEIVIFGGTTGYPPKNAENISDTAVLRFGKC